VGAQHPALEPIERASEDELRALQLQRLKWAVQHAYDNVAAYRGKCERAGVHPAQLRRLEDLACFPFTLKDDLREHYPFGLFAVPRERLVRLHASSGTTGKPTIVGYTRAEFQETVDALASRRIDPRPMITDIITVDRVPEMFEALKSPGARAKVMVEFPH